MLWLFSNKQFYFFRKSNYKKTRNCSDSNGIWAWFSHSQHESGWLLFHTSFVGLHEQYSVENLTQTISVKYENFLKKKTDNFYSSKCPLKRTAES